MKKNVFPFTAIVGQEKIKKALVLNAINPSIGGVLIKGDRGTGKTTAVRSLARLLPKIEIIDSCIFNSDKKSYFEFELFNFYNKSIDDDIKLSKTPMKVIELPLGATEDRVVGSLDIKKALHDGIKALEPGILAQANGNILYIDEINLLDDSLVDVLLDAAAYGVNTIEREGISITHPSKFILMGTMNPEEGELRGQLSDRIGLKISVTGIENIEDRIKIMKRLSEFEKNPEKFISKYESKENELQKKIICAKELLPSVIINDEYIEIIARISRNLGVEGHRTDISILKTAKTVAAYNGNWRVDMNDLEEAILLVLGELKSCDNQKKVQDQIQQAQNEINEENNENDESNSSDDQNQNSSKEENKDEDENNDHFNELNQSNSSDFNENINDQENYEDGKSDENLKNDDNRNDDFENNDLGNNDSDNNNLDNNKNNNLDDLNDDSENNDYRNENQLQGEVNESDLYDNEYQIEHNENIAQKGMNEFDIESLEKDIRKMLVMEGREKEKIYGSRVDSKSEKGKYVKSKYSPKVTPSDIALDATLRAAALRSNRNNSNNSNNSSNSNNVGDNDKGKKNNNYVGNNGLKVNIQDIDIREKIRKHKARASIAIVIDMSGSMLSEKKVNMIRGILEKIIKNINKNRDKLAVIGFKGQDSEIIIPNTKHPSSFLSKLDTITVGGTTPMAAGLKKALELLKKEKKGEEFIPMLILLSDGMPNVGLKNDHIKNTRRSPINDVLAIGEELGDNDIYTIIIDFEKKHKHGRNINMELAFKSNGRHYNLEDIYNPDIAIDKILTYERNNL